MVERLEGGLLARLEGALGSPGSATERLASGYRNILEFINEHTILYQVFREAEFIRREIARRFYTNITGALGEALGVGVDRGEVRPLDPAVTAYSILGIAEFIAMRYIIWERGALSEEVFQNSVKLIHHGLDTGKELRSLPSDRATAPLDGLAESGEVEPQGGEATRQALLAAAERMFGQVGFHRTTIAEITYIAGVAQGTFYLYFPSKVAIFAELVGEINRQFRAEERAAISSLADRREVERRGFEAFFKFISRHREAYRIIREAEFVDERAGRWYYQRLAQGYVRGLRRGMDRGEIRRLDPEPLAYALLGIGHFVGLRWIVWEEREALPERVLTAMLDFIMRGIAPAR